MTTVVFAQNPFEKSTWKRFEEDSLVRVLLEEVGPFPSTARIYRDSITQSHDITPLSKEAAEALPSVMADIFYIVVWPEGAAVLPALALNTAIILATPALKLWMYDHNKDWKPAKVPAGSPNNLPGDRQNVARVQQRIPDIYGRVKSTPDLLQLPYITYDRNLQVETYVACIGRGSFDVNSDEVFEGKTRADQIPGSSIAIYPPGEVPGSGTPQLEIGDPITDPLYNVVACKEVTGEVLLPPNNTVVFGDGPVTQETKTIKDRLVGVPIGDVSTGILFPARSPIFTYMGGGIGQFFINLDQHPPEAKLYLPEIFAVGNRFGLDWQPHVHNSRPTDTGIVEEQSWGSISVHDVALRMGDEDFIPDLQLLPETPEDPAYVVTDIDFTTSVGTGNLLTMTVQFSMPVALEAEWENIALFNDGSHPDSNVASGSCANKACMFYAVNFRQGPFFVNDPSMEKVSLNFVAERGLWIDDGSQQRAFGDSVITEYTEGIELVVQITPADEGGTASGATENFTVEIKGSATNRNFIGTTVVLEPSFSGRFLIACYRNTLTYFKVQASSYRYFLPNEDGDGIDEETNWSQSAKTIMGTGQDYFTLPAQVEDEIKWTHCYSLSIPKYRATITDLGNITTVHSRLAQQRVKTSSEDIEKRLNMVVTRKTDTWNEIDQEFDGTLQANRSGANAAFDILRDPLIGGIEDSKIDAQGIVDAFQAVSNAFSTGTAATSFDHTFDSEEMSVEDMLVAIGQSCFVIFYRQGDIIKARPDISTDTATLVFNHRNILPGTQNFTVSFGSEEDYDGVELEYTDVLDEQTKIYAIPGNGAMKRPRKLTLAGVKTRQKAAVLAWREYNRILYQRFAVEFEACEEAALNLIKDKVLVANVNKGDLFDGEIVRIDGLTVYTSQSCLLEDDEEYTLFIQDVDGSTATLEVIANEDDSSHSLILGSALPVDLVIDTSAGIYPRYFLAKNSNTVPSAFQVVETSFNRPGIYNVSCVNYSEALYFNDDIRLFVTFDPVDGYPPIHYFTDRSPNEYDFTFVGAGTSVIDPGFPSRGGVFWAVAPNAGVSYEEALFNSNASYTIACWLNRSGTAESAFLFDSTGGQLFFGINSDDELYLSHEAVFYISGVPAPAVDEWHHIALTFDRDAEIARLYVDGVEISTAIDVPPVTPGFTGMHIMYNFANDSYGDDFRLYMGCKSAAFIRELYQKTRVF